MGRLGSYPEVLSVLISVCLLLFSSLSLFHPMPIFRVNMLICRMSMLLYLSELIWASSQPTTWGFRSILEDLDLKISISICIYTHQHPLCVSYSVSIAGMKWKNIHFNGAQSFRCGSNVMGSRTVATHVSGTRGTGVFPFSSYGNLTNRNQPLWLYWLFSAQLPPITQQPNGKYLNCLIRAECSSCMVRQADTIQNSGSLLEGY